MAPTPAWNLGEKADDPVQRIWQIFTHPIGELAGLPAMSVPAGSVQQRPIGVQILIGNYQQEARLLNVAHQFQQVTDWHQRRPAI